MRSLLPTLVTALALTGCASVSEWLGEPPPPLGDRLTGESLRTTLAGNSLVTQEDLVPPLVVYFGTGGDLHGMRSNNYRDTGTWEVENDAVCGAWDNWYGTMSRCWEVYRSGDKLTLKRQDEGTMAAGKLIPGDVGGLK